MLKSKSKLDNDSKLVYDNILSAWETYNPNPSFQINKNVNMQKIFEYIKYDNPGLFFIDFKNIAVSGSGSSVKVQTNFLYNKKQINNMEKQIEAIIVSILSSDKFKSSDNYNKEIILHDYLTENIVYTMNNSTNETTSIAGAFITKKAVCEGFAKAFKLLCDNAGLSCIFVSGKAVSPQLNYYLKNKLCAASREEFIKFIKEQAKQGKKMISVKLTGREITNDQLMKAVNEALFGIIKPGQQLGFQYNKYRHIVKVKIL